MDAPDQAFMGEPLTSEEMEQVRAEMRAPVRAALVEALRQSTHLGYVVPKEAKKHKGVEIGRDIRCAYGQVVSAGLLSPLGYRIARTLQAKAT